MGSCAYSVTTLKNKLCLFQLQKGGLTCVYGHKVLTYTRTLLHHDLKSKSSTHSLVVSESYKSPHWQVISLLHHVHVCQRLYHVLSSLCNIA